MEGGASREVHPIPLNLLAVGEDQGLEKSLQVPVDQGALTPKCSPDGVGPETDSSYDRT